MAKCCCDCTWRCPLYDSDKCYSCRYNFDHPNFEIEKHPGYGTKAAELLQKNEAVKNN